MQLNTKILWILWKHMDNKHKNLLFPNYEHDNIINFISTLLYHYGVKPNHRTLNSLNFSFNKTLIFLLDAMGYYQFTSQFKNYNPLKLTTVFPSTTATALTSIFTEQEPIQHGVLGFTTFLNQYGLTANCITMKSTVGNIDVTKFFVQDSTIFERLNKNNVATYSLLPHSISNSGLSQILYTGSETISYYSLNDIKVVLDQLKNSKSKSLTFIYYPNYDTICHKYGPNSINAKNELGSLVEFVEYISNSFKDYNIFVFADHGQISTPKEYFHFWKDYPELLKQFIIPPFCEPRVNMYFSKRELQNDFKKVFNNFITLSKEEMLNKGIFGNGARYSDRLGNNMLLFLDSSVMMAQMSPFYPPPIFLGMHGSISKEEIFVPLIQLR